MFDSSKQPPVITIVSIKKQNATVLPEIGMVVTCKVKKIRRGENSIFRHRLYQVSSINYRMAKVAILGVEDRIIKDTFRGTIRYIELESKKNFLYNTFTLERKTSERQKEIKSKFRNRSDQETLSGRKW